LKGGEKMNDIDIETAWDYLVDKGIATEQELILVTYINGYNMESLNDIIYVRTAFHDVEQLQEKDEEIEEY
jgi:hypothetical protein